MNTTSTKARELSSSVKTRDGRLAICLERLRIEIGLHAAREPRQQMQENFKNRDSTHPPRVFRVIKFNRTAMSGPCFGSSSL